MGTCKHTVYKKGKRVLSEIMPNKGLSYEDKLGIQVSNNAENKKMNIWVYRRDMGGFTTANHKDNIIGNLTPEQIA